MAFKLVPSMDCTGWKAGLGTISSACFFVLMVVSCASAGVQDIIETRAITMVLADSLLKIIKLSLKFSVKSFNEQLLRLFNLLFQQSIRCCLTDESEVGFSVGRTDVEPPLGELYTVTVEIHLGSRGFT